jgi:ABC-type branched-subunit amino acid transport system permease subunit
MAAAPAREQLLKRSVKAGLVGGGATVYVAVVGLLQALDERDFIYPILTLAPALILLVNVLSGYFASRPARLRPGEPEPPAPPPGLGVLSGAIAGLVSGLLPALLLVIGDTVNLRAVLVAVNPTLFEILGWGQGAVTGALILLGAGALFGTIGAAVHLLSARDRKPFIVALTVVGLVSMASTLVEDTLENLGDELGEFGDTIGLNLQPPFLEDTDWLYRSDGLSIEPPFFAAVVIFVLAFVISLMRSRRGEVLDAGRRTRQISPERQELLTFVCAIALLAMLWILLQREFRAIFATAVVIFVGAVAIVFWRSRRDVNSTERTDRVSAGQHQLRFFLTITALLAVLPALVGSSHSNTLVIVGLYVLLGLGLNIVVGYAGLLDLGYVAFFAIGAYATAMLTSPDSFLASNGDGFMGFWLALPLVVIVSTFCGVLIGAPVLRLRGDYLAIVTLGFGEIVRILVQAPALKTWTGGSQGITQIPEPGLGTFQFDTVENLYYLIVVCCIGAIFISYRLQDSRIGRSWIAMREDEQVAEATGISIIKTKLLAFAMGAAIGSFSGMFVSVQIGSVFPQSLTIIVSVTVLALLVLGGMGSIPGVIVGSFVLVGLPELLREFDEFRLHIYGGLLVAIMILRPEGLIPSARRRLELHEEEEEQLQYERRHGDEETGAPVVVAAQPKDMT